MEIRHIGILLVVLGTGLLAFSLRIISGFVAKGFTPDPYHEDNVTDPDNLSEKLASGEWRIVGIHRPTKDERKRERQRRLQDRVMESKEFTKLMDKARRKEGIFSPSETYINRWLFWGGLLCIAVGSLMQW